MCCNVLVNGRSKIGSSPSFIPASSCYPKVWAEVQLNLRGLWDEQSFGGIPMDISGQVLKGSPKINVWDAKSRTRQNIAKFPKKDFLKRFLGGRWGICLGILQGFWFWRSSLPLAKPIAHHSGCLGRDPWAASSSWKSSPPPLPYLRFIMGQHSKN